MARPRKTDSPDLAAPVNLTVGVIDRLTCPQGKAQAFLRDAAGNGLRVRVTPSGAKAFVFEQSLNGRTMRRTIGNVTAWTIDDARKAAKDLSATVDKGTDPRELEREAAKRKADAAAMAAAQRKADAVTVGDAWARYLAERRPHWGDRNYSDHEDMARAGGAKRKRGTGPVTKPGPLASLMPLPLKALDGPAVEAWATREAVDRPARVRLALRLLKAFLRWAAAEPDLKGRADPAAASAKKARDAAGRAARKDDVLERGQLSAWFARVQQLSPAIAAYLQTMLLTGARPGEVVGLRWADINAQWKGITIRDKVEGERQIPLTPYVWHLLSKLPKRNEWVFSSTRAVSLEPVHVTRRARYHEKRGTLPPVGGAAQVSESGRLIDPSHAHRQACSAAGIEGLTLHGLRRSFASLTEWLETPAGVVAQIQGHKPSATAEKHYKRRPLDLLRVHHERIEAWILEQAGIAFDPKASETTGPRLVVANE